MRVASVVFYLLQLIRADFYTGRIDFHAVRGRKKESILATGDVGYWQFWTLLENNLLMARPPAHARAHARDACIPLERERQRESDATVVGGFLKINDCGHS